MKKSLFAAAKNSSFHPALKLLRTDLRSFMQSTVGGILHNLMALKPLNVTLLGLFLAVTVQQVHGSDNTWSWWDKDFTTESWFENKEKIQELLNKKPNLNKVLFYTNKNGNTILYDAIEFNDMTIVQDILNKLTNIKDRLMLVKHQNKINATPLHYLAWFVNNDAKQIADMLIQGMVDNDAQQLYINMIDNDNNTALHKLAERISKHNYQVYNQSENTQLADVEMWKWLIDKGAKIDLKNKDNHNPINILLTFKNNPFFQSLDNNKKIIIINTVFKPIFESIENYASQDENLLQSIKSLETIITASSPNQLSSSPVVQPNNSSLGNNYLNTAMNYVRNLLSNVNKSQAIAAMISGAVAYNISRNYNAPWWAKSIAILGGAGLTASLINKIWSNKKLTDKALKDNVKLTLEPKEKTGLHEAINDIYDSIKKYSVDKIQSRFEFDELRKKLEKFAVIFNSLIDKDLDKLFIKNKNGQSSYYLLIIAIGDTTNKNFDNNAKNIFIEVAFKPIIKNLINKLSSKNITEKKELQSLLNKLSLSSSSSSSSSSLPYSSSGMTRQTTNAYAAQFQSNSSSLTNHEQQTLLEEMNYLIAMKNKDNLGRFLTTYQTKLDQFINTPNNSYTTSLNLAVVNDSFDIVDLLLRNGADPTIKDHAGFPLAVRYNNLKQLQNSNKINNIDILQDRISQLLIKELQHKFDTSRNDNPNEAQKIIEAATINILRNGKGIPTIQITIPAQLPLDETHQITNLNK